MQTQHHANYATFTIGECLRFNASEHATGAHVECDGDKQHAARIARIDANHRASWPEKQIAALRASANSGNLSRIEHEIMFAIGADVCQKGFIHPRESDNPDKLAAVWDSAMSNMRAFYNVATGRKKNDYAV